MYWHKYINISSLLIFTFERNDLYICFLFFIATHLLNAALRILFKKVTFQLSSEVKRNHLKFEVGLIGKRLCKDDVHDIENVIRLVNYRKH